MISVVEPAMLRHSEEGDAFGVSPVEVVDFVADVGVGIENLVAELIAVDLVAGVGVGIEYLVEFVGIVIGKLELLVVDTETVVSENVGLL